MKHFLSSAVFAVVVAATCNSVAAREPGCAPTEDITSAAGCRDAENELALQVCLADAMATADAVLNETYAKLLKALAGMPGEKAIKESQRAWVRFRDLDCHYYVSGLGVGALRVEDDVLCRTARTKSRTRQLEEFLACDSNGCPQQYK